MNRCRHGTLVFVTALSMVTSAGAGQRVKEVAGRLPAEPAGLGRPITDRSAWETLAELDAFKKVIRSAERLVRGTRVSQRMLACVLISAGV